MIETKFKLKKTDYENVVSDFLLKSLVLVVRSFENIFI